MNYNPQQMNTEPTKERVLAQVSCKLLAALGIRDLCQLFLKAALLCFLYHFLTFGVGAPVMAVISLIEGILYLTKSDAEFYQTYVQNKKEWF